MPRFSARHPDSKSRTAMPEKMLNVPSRSTPLPQKKAVRGPFVLEILVRKDKYSESDLPLAGGNLSLVAHRVPLACEVNSYQ
jgi:predicted nuclease of restriction endonuclease-like (RecB) superfamily